MRFRAPISISALITCFYLLTWVIPLGVSGIYGEAEQSLIFATVGGIAFFVLLAVYIKYKDNHLQKMDGFLVVVLTWQATILLSSLPFYFSEVSSSFIDSWLEAVSALTTTGIECIGGVSEWPMSLLWYRQQLEWVGGVGIIIMMISLLSLHEGAILSIYHSEFGQGIRDVRVTPRLSSTARYVCFIYGGLWVGCTLCFYFTGVPIIYAMMEAMATVSTGGFSLEQVMPIYHIPYTQWTAIIFMVLGAIGFHTHYQVIRGKSLKVYFQHTEVRTMILLLITASAIVMLLNQSYDFTTLIFEVAAFLTTTGFETEVHTTSPFILLMFVLLGLCGACAGSTAGGLKLIRIHVVFQEAKGLLMRLLYPSIVYPISVNGKALSSNYVENIIGYIALFIVTFFASMMIFLMLGVPLNQTFYLLCASITNVGGAVGPLGIEQLTSLQKFVLSIVMILGRLEIAAPLVLCMPRYWRSN